MTSAAHTLLAVAALCVVHALQPTWAARPALRCEPLEPALARTLQPGALLLLGELHGSMQSPGMAERFVCAALRRQSRVALFLEIPADEQPRIDAYLQSDGGLDARHTLVRGSPFWGWPDGRSSVAMLGLIDAARRWQQAGAALSLIGFDAAQNADERDPAMADRVRAERARDPARVLITYTGNVHNMLALRPDMPPGTAVPMGTRLADLRPVSLVLWPFAGGAAWNCSDACGVHRMPAVPTSQQRMLRQELRRSYTAIVPLGPVTPSIPAAARLDARAAM